MKGFTLIELLIVIAILMILTTILFVLINPLEINKKAKDAVRLVELSALSQTIHIVSQKNSEANDLCFHTEIPCSGISFPEDFSTRLTDGTGWIKVNFQESKDLQFPMLPLDPVNNGPLYYRYQSDGENWELNTVLESETYKDMMKNDGGNNPNKYEIGSDLNLIN